MTKKSNKPAEIDPAGQYQVTLSKPIKYGRVWLRPNAERVRVSGSTLLEIQDAVESYDRVADPAA